MVDSIDETKLIFDTLASRSDLSIINLTEDDNIDTLNVRGFLINDAETYLKNNLTTVWKVSYGKKIIAFFTVSMNGMEASIIPADRKVEGMRGRYPAILLGQMWVDKKFRGRKVGYWICQYVIGLARKINLRIACSCVVLQTDESKVDFYEKALFVRSIKAKGNLIWMYRSIG